MAKTLDRLVVIVIAAGVVYSLLLRPDPIMTISSQAYHPTNTYRQATAKTISSLKDRNKLSFDEAGLKAALMRQFPEVTDVTVNLPFFGQLPAIHIAVAEPSLILRGTIGSAEDLVVDSKGTIVGPRSSFSSIKELPVITDETGFKTSVGKAVLSQTDVNFILTILSQTQRARVPVASLTLPKLPQEVDLRTSDRNYFVRFYLGGDALTQSGQFLAARQQFDRTNKQPQQYLDVRVTGKIYYK